MLNTFGPSVIESRLDSKFGGRAGIVSYSPPTCWGKCLSHLCVTLDMVL